MTAVVVACVPTRIRTEGAFAARGTRRGDDADCRVGSRCTAVIGGARTDAMDVRHHALLGVDRNFVAALS